MEKSKIYPIILNEHNPRWAEWFDEEKDNIKRLLNGEIIADIHHYGSTSIPGLLAKPTIDILLEIDESIDIKRIIEAMPSPEYICLYGDMLTTPTKPPHLTIIKGYLPEGFAERVYHIHVVYKGEHEELRFRDYLKSNPQALFEYTELKRKLLSEYKYDRDGYTHAKSEFIISINQKVREDSGL